MAVNVAAQHHVPFDAYFQYPFEKEVVANRYRINNSMKPFHKKQLNYFFNYDSLLNSYYSIKTDSTKSWFHRKLLQENFLEINKKDFSLAIDPVVILSLGKEQIFAVNTFRNTRAVRLEGSLGKKITFASEFYENQARFPYYLTENIDQTIVVPGQGVKRDFGNGGYDFNWAEGQLTYHPTKKIILEFGNGKHFIGNGYRSLFLSDNAFNYPYLKTTFTTERFYYSKIVMSLMHGIYNVNRSNTLYERKTANIHYFGFFLGDNVQFSFFESNMWTEPDSTAKPYFNIGYINPIPLLNAFFEENNTSVGFNVSINLFKKITLYNQTLLGRIVFPGFDIKKQFAMQNGFKYYDVFSIRHLNLVSEINFALPYTYSKDNPERSYSHYNQALAHPLGANFMEGVFIVNYHIKRFGLNYKLVGAYYGEDGENTNYGKDIFKSTKDKTSELPDHKIIQGIKTKLIHNDLYFSYIINPKTNFRCKLGLLTRNLSSDVNSDDTVYLYFSLETALKNFYYDF